MNDWIKDGLPTERIREEDSVVGQMKRLEVENIKPKGGAPNGEEQNPRPVL